MPKRDPILDLLDEKDKIIKRQADIIHAADKMYDAARVMPRRGFSANEKLAETTDAYEAAKKKASGEQEQQ